MTMGRIHLDLLGLADFAYQRLHTRLAGLTDEEYLWEPAPAAGRSGGRTAEPGAPTGRSGR
jgi:hypothetical protein